MELRTYNVQRVYKDVVKVVVQDKVGVNENFDKYIPQIKDMISQVRVDFRNTFPLSMGHIRKDGEQWTPYLQPVIMLVQLANRAKLVSYEGRLTPMTIIKVND